MNGQSNTHSWVESTQNYLSQMLRPCLGYLPFIQRQYQVHPETDKPANSKFVRLTSQRRVRVVHIVNNNTTECAHVMRLSEINVRKSNISTVHSDSKCSSLISAKTMQSNSPETLEDYWFTRWSRPLTTFDSCNCSFRKSGRSLVRDSKFSQHIIIESKENFDEINVSGSVKSNRKRFVGNISLLEDYVESLLHKTLTEVFVHLSKHKNISGGFDIHSEKSSMKIQNSDDVTVGCINPSFVGSGSDPDVLDFGGLTQIFQVEQDGFLTRENNDNNSSVCALIMSPHAAAQKTYQSGQPEYKKHSSIIILDEDKRESTHTVILATISNPNDAASQTKELANSTNHVSKMVTKPNREANEFNIEEQSPNVNVEIRKKKCTHDNKTKLKPLLYFLHGVGSSADLWTGLVHHFTRAGFECVAPDMLGHGYSAAPDQASAYTFTRMLKDTLDIFDQYVGSRKCVVIGHAYGCSLAAAVARYRCEQVGQLVLISGGGPTPLAPRTADSKTPALPFCLQICLKPLLMCGFRRNLLYAPCGKHINSNAALSGGVPQYVLHHVAHGQDWPEGDSTFHRRILVPTLIVHGMQDPYVTLVQECEMERTIPRSFLEVIPNAGHLPMLETPSQLSHMIHCFIDWWS